MYETALVIIHRFEPQSLFRIIRSKDAELAFLSLTPLNVVFKILQCFVGIGDVVVCVIGVDVQSRRQLSIALQTQTFVVTRQSLTLEDWIDLRGVTAFFFLEVLTLARYNHLGWAWFVFFTWVWCMALVET